MYASTSCLSTSDTRRPAYSRKRNVFIAPGRLADEQPAPSPSSERRCLPRHPSSSAACIRFLPSFPCATLLANIIHLRITGLFLLKPATLVRPSLCSAPRCAQHLRRPAAPPGSPAPAPLLLPLRLPRKACPRLNTTTRGSSHARRGR